MKRSEIRDCIPAHETPDYAALHPGYACLLRHARAYRNAHADQNKVPNNLLANEPSLSTQGIGGSCGS